MVATPTFDSPMPISSPPESGQQKKHFQIISRTYQSNLESDYTERIEQLGKEFDYQSNSQHYWGVPEQSTMYGTPLFDQASDSQKLALNHLYWVGQYQHTASAESNTILYNNITAGVFATMSDYGTLCEELSFETSQERHHIQTFQRIGYRTKMALLGKEAMGNPLHKKMQETANKSPWKQVAKALPQPNQASWKAMQESIFRSTTKMLLADKSQHFSLFLKDADELPTASGGLAAFSAPPSALRFLGLNWGSSPFLAAQYYSARMIANMSLKAYEYRYYKQFRDLQRDNQFIPAPIAVSHYHLLDEAFHTTMSQVISQEVYRDFAKPTAYEKLLANVIVYLVQKGVLGGLSAALPVTFKDDAAFMPSYYRLLTSRLFDMSKQDALHWMEQSLCKEHEGFHANLAAHQHLLGELQRFFGRLEYLHPVNREMRIMAAGGSIETAIKRNQEAFQQFSRSVA
jgi:hypothetical protein